MTPTTLAADAAQALQGVTDLIARLKAQYDCSLSRDSIAALTALSEQNTAFAAQVAELAEAHNRMTHDWGVADRARMDAEAKVARLEASYWKMRSYATHDDGCKLNKPPSFSGPCSCGLFTAMHDFLETTAQEGTPAR